MGPYEIFGAADGKMVYTETNRSCFDSSSIVWADYAIRDRDLADFLAMSGDERILLSPDCPARDPRFKPLEPSYRVSEVTSLVVFDEWCEADENTPALALYEREANGDMVCTGLYGAEVKDIPQRLWEIIYPSSCVRIMMKIRRHFFFADWVWYFIGRKTKTLYLVSRDEVYLNSDAYGTHICNDTGEPGVSDGLGVQWLRKDQDGFYYFHLDVLKGTDYRDKQIKHPEEIAALARTNSEIASILSEILTGDEFKLL